MCSSDLAIWNFDTSTFDAVNFPQLTAEGVLTQKINDIFDGLVVTVGQTADGLITEKGLRVAGDAALSGRVSTLEADPTTQSALSTETTNRQNADTTLQTNITNEAASRLAADNALDTRVTATETTLGDRTATQIGYVDATSSIQTQLDTKITESAVALLIASEADNLQTQLNDINTRLTNAGY